jgi:hypothetical protein
MKTNYVLIDYENVPARSLEQLSDDRFKVIVFVGASQAKIPCKLRQSTQPLGPRAQFIKISSHGRNALDFHIAYYIGRLVIADPSAYFHIISKDKGYDPLIQHLKSQKIIARRVDTIGNILVGKPSNSKSPPEHIAVILAKLQGLKAAKPRTIKTLSSTIAFWFKNHLSENEIASLIESLRSRGYLQVDGAKLTYALPSSGLKKS